MLKQEHKTRLKELGFDIDTLEKAIKDEKEVDITIPEGNLYTDQTLQSRDASKISEGKRAGFAEGKKAGFEIANKAIIEKFGLKDVDKDAEPKDLAELAFTSASKGDDGLKEQVKLLQKDKETLSNQLTQKEKEAKDAIFTASLVSYLPEKRIKALDNTEHIARVKRNIEFEELDGIIVPKRNGEILRDPKTQKPLDIKSAIENLYTENKWIETEEPKGGRGVGDKPPVGGGSKTFSEAEKQFKIDHPDLPITGTEFSSYIQECAKDKDFDMNK